MFGKVKPLIVLGVTGETHDGKIPVGKIEVLLGIGSYDAQQQVDLITDWVHRLTKLSKEIMDANDSVHTSANGQPSRFNKGDESSTQGDSGPDMIA